VFEGVMVVNAFKLVILSVEFWKSVSWAEYNPENLWNA
jgi:hypothetical protein